MLQNSGQNQVVYSGKTDIAMEIPPFVDVFPMGKGEFPASYVSLPEGNHCQVSVVHPSPP